MDSRSMNKRGFYGNKKVDEKQRKPKQKAYCLFEKEGYIYFPVAAQLAPYEGENKKRAETYLAGMPNFFGGNINIKKKETVECALAREMEEESQGNIQVEILRERLGKPVFAEPAGGARKDQDSYKFYLLGDGGYSIKKFRWEGECTFKLCPWEKGGKDAGQHPEHYEDSFLVRLEKGDFIRFISGLLDLKEASDEDRRAGVDRLMGEFGIAGLSTPASISNWYNSHTFAAFAACLNKI